MPLMDKSSRLLTSPMSKAKTKRTDSAQSGSTNGGASGTDLPRTLVVDVGASGIKATLLNDLGKAIGERRRGGGSFRRHRWSPT